MPRTSRSLRSPVFCVQPTNPFLKLKRFRSSLAPVKFCWMANPSKERRHRPRDKPFLFESHLESTSWPGRVATHFKGSNSSLPCRETQQFRRVGRFTGRILLRQNVRTVMREKSQEISRGPLLRRHASAATSKNSLQRATLITMKSWPSVSSATIPTDPPSSFI